MRNDLAILIPNGLTKRLVMLSQNVEVHKTHLDSKPGTYCKPLSSNKKTTINLRVKLTAPDSLFFFQFDKIHYSAQYPMNSEHLNK